MILSSSEVEFFRARVRDPIIKFLTSLVMKFQTFFYMCGEPISLSVTNVFSLKNYLHVLILLLTLNRFHFFSLWLFHSFMIKCTGVYAYL